MQIIQTKFIIGLLVLFSVAGAALAYIPAASPIDTIQPPELPAACASLQVGTDQEVIFHAYALGVQIYRWNGTAWVFVAPSATLYADADYRGKVATHYAGPTWESNSGSNVVAARVNGCSVDPTAIDWLLLHKVSSAGPGIFEPVTYVQRVNTTGGKAPATPGSYVGAEARVPYTAEYYFYQNRY